MPVTGELTLAEGVDVSGSVPITFGDYGIDAPSPGFLRVDDNGAVEFLLRLRL